MEMFAKVVKMGLTFDSQKGQLTPQQLWTLPLTGNNGFNLDEISKVLLKKINSCKEESLVGESKVSVKDTLRLEVLKFIIEDKKQELAVKEQSVLVDAQKQQIQEIIHRKEQQKLEDLSVEDLKKMLES